MSIVIFATHLGVYTYYSYSKFLFNSAIVSCLDLFILKSFSIFRKCLTCGVFNHYVLWKIIIIVFALNLK